MEEDKVKKDKVKVNEQLEKYKCFLEQMRYEGEFLWRIFGAFLLPQSIFLAFLLSVGIEKGRLTGWGPSASVAAIAGFLLCLVWMFVCYRSVAYYHFWVAQVMEAEKPLAWDLMKGRREDFKKGCPVKIGERCCRMDWYQKIKVRYGLYLVIWIFLIIYVIIIFCGP